MPAFNRTVVCDVDLSVAHDSYKLGVQPRPYKYLRMVQRPGAFDFSIDGGASWIPVSAAGEKYDNIEFSEIWVRNVAGAGTARVLLGWHNPSPDEGGDAQGVAMAIMDWWQGLPRWTQAAVVLGVLWVLLKGGSRR